MLVVPLSEARDAGEVGGKAAALGELIRRGERVPDGFCVTAGTGELPRTAIVTAYQKMGEGPVAVRSSATAEDLPDASYAGQMATFPGITGADEVLAAIARCRESLHSERAAAYHRTFGHGSPRMAVIVQRMVDAERAGVLFTANPLTGCRTRMMVDSAPGLGTTVVDGTAEVDHRVLDGANLDDPDQSALWALGERLQRHFGAPQDIEWATDRDGALWVLQSRPITTLFPLPPPTPDMRIYVEFGHVQGMLQPVTPMGVATLRTIVDGMLASLGIRAALVDIGGRLYGDLTDLVRSRSARKRLVQLMAVDFGPRAQAVLEHVLADPRFAPANAKSLSRPGNLGPAVSGILRSLARPAAARKRMERAVNDLRAGSAAPGEPLSRADRLRFVSAHDSLGSSGDIVWPIVAGMLAAALPAHLLKGLARPGELHTVLGGMPHNVTIEMDLELWRIARDGGDLDAFLREYGHRTAAEVDVGVPRWAEDPTPVHAMIANYRRVTDPDDAPDRRFARAAEAAATALDDLAVRARRRPIRGRLAIFLLRRARELAGLRETGKFAGLYRLQAVRRQLLLLGAELFDDPADIMFLTLDEVHAAVADGADLRATVAGRRAVHERESRRRHVPVALLSDGTDLEAVLARPESADGVLEGVGASPGRVTGPARVVHDPATARIDPGDILVAATTDPGWTPLFLTAAALVTDTGAVMAHGPTVAREYGIPAVISVRDATSTIATGQLLTVDGTAGTVELC
jgi:phosphohistidine swiveling domain-containing protein